MASRIALTLFLLATALLPACDGGDKPKPDSAVPGDGAMCAGTIAYLQPCTASDECTSCVCQSFGHSKICTKTCTLPEDCPAPSGGCSMGFCRP
jgi:hypothetical protein